MQNVITLTLLLKKKRMLKVATFLSGSLTADQTSKEKNMVNFDYYVVMETQTSKHFSDYLKKDFCQHDEFLKKENHFK